MGCPSDVKIGENLVFSITTHDPDTGVVTDADSAPSYRVYEDETITAILTGTMAKLDDANTTGFYTESIACTSANGFEDGRTYTVYVEATVGGDTGAICYGFKAHSGAAEHTILGLASIPAAIDVADTATVRLALHIIDANGPLPTAAQITPGTISIDRKARGATSWTSVVSEAGCSEADGTVYHDEVFDSANGYAEGDVVRITFKGQKITIGETDYVVHSANGGTYWSHVPKVAVYASD
jgi:hypothetical protein